MKVVSHSGHPSRPSRPGRPDRPGRPGRPGRPDRPDCPGRLNRPDEVQPRRNAQLRNNSSISHSQTHARNSTPSMAIDIDEINLTSHPSDDESLPTLEEILVLRPRQAQRQQETERQGFISPDGS